MDYGPRNRDRGIVAMIASIHRTLERIILDPLDARAYEVLDVTADLLWQRALSLGDAPWRYCLDRYCGCKVTLAEHEPDPLPLEWGAPAAFGDTREV